VPKPSSGECAVLWSGRGVRVPRGGAWVGVRKIPGSQVGVLSASVRMESREVGATLVEIGATLVEVGATLVEVGMFARAPGADRVTYGDPLDA